MAPSSHRPRRLRVSDPGIWGRLQALPWNTDRVREVVTDRDADFRYFTRRSSALALAGLAVVGVVVVLLVISRPKHLTGGGDALLVAGGFVLLGLIVAGFARTSAEVGPDGVRLTTVFHATHLPWREIESFRYVPGDKGGVFVVFDGARSERLPTNRPSRSRDEHGALLCRQLEALDRYRHLPSP
jgi:hypothetical protein